MSNKKMCEWDGKCIHTDKYGFSAFHKCPTNTNSRCEIIPAKRKRVAKRTKTVKGWGYSEDGKELDSIMLWKTTIHTTPCTITFVVKEKKK